MSEKNFGMSSVYLYYKIVELGLEDIYENYQTQIIVFILRSFEGVLWNFGLRTNLNTWKMEMVILDQKLGSEPD